MAPAAAGESIRTRGPVRLLDCDPGRRDRGVGWSAPPWHMRRHVLRQASDQPLVSRRARIVCSAGPRDLEGAAAARLLILTTARRHPGQAPVVLIARLRGRAPKVPNGALALLARARGDRLGPAMARSNVDQVHYVRAPCAFDCERLPMGPPLGWRDLPTAAGILAANRSRRSGLGSTARSCWASVSLLAGPGRPGCAARLPPRVARPSAAVFTAPVTQTRWIPRDHYAQRPARPRAHG